MSSRFVSVIIPTYQRNQLLKRCLAALVAQDFDPAAYEIIVVDDANSEETRKLVMSWAESTTAIQFYTQIPDTGSSYQAVASGNARVELPVFEDIRFKLDNLPAIRYLAVTQPDHGPGLARNLGWRSATGEWIAFTDDDCIPQPDWLKKGMQALENADGASGQVIVPLPDQPTDYELNTRGLERSVFVTANCFYRRSALELTGGFDERFKAAWREDTDLYFTLLEKGLRLVSVPSAVVIHPVRPAGWGISLRQQTKNLYNALLYKKHPRAYRKFLQPWPPALYYLVLAALAAALAGFAAGRAALGWGGLAAWTGLVGYFCLKRLKNTAHTPAHVLEMLLTSVLIPPVAVFWRLKGAVRYRVLFL